MESSPSDVRKDQCARIRKALCAEFPSAEIGTNDDANPATPFIVTAKWAQGRIRKVVRADSVRSTVEQFLAKASAVLQAFQTESVPTRHLQEAAE